MEYYKNLDLADIEYFCAYDLVWKTEQWKDVVGYKRAYGISDLGRIKGNERRILYSNGSSYIKPASIKKSSIAENGYLHTMLRYHNRNKYEPIHKLVAMAFLGHKPSKHSIVVDHYDENKINNVPQNLKLITSRKNISKSMRNKTSKYEGVRRRLNRGYTWEISIYITKKIHLGCSNNEHEAGELYKKALDNINNYNGNSKEFRTLVKSLL